METFTKKITNYSKFSSILFASKYKMFLLLLDLKKIHEKFSFNKKQKKNPFWKKQEIKKMKKMKKETSGNICFFGFLFLIAKELHHLHKVFVGGG